ncbi:hypothetical protein DFH06DRAFT_1191652 [Mycena polygramma]|nr:hypothetical protein DFH06DRAFT_1191652 [Mycena polygramma]
MLFHSFSVIVILRHLGAVSMSSVARATYPPMTFRPEASVTELEKADVAQSVPGALVVAEGPAFLPLYLDDRLTTSVKLRGARATSDLRASI